MINIGPCILFVVVSFPSFSQEMASMPSVQDVVDLVLAVEYKLRGEVGAEWREEREASSGHDVSSSGLGSFSWTNWFDFLRSWFSGGGNGKGTPTPPPATTSRSLEPVVLAASSLYPIPPKFCGIGFFGDQAGIWVRPYTGHDLFHADSGYGDCWDTGYWHKNRSELSGVIECNDKDSWTASWCRARENAVIEINACGAKAFASGSSDLESGEAWTDGCANYFLHPTNTVTSIVCKTSDLLGLETNGVWESSAVENGNVRHRCVAAP